MYPIKALLNTEKPEKTLSCFNPVIITDIHYNQSRKVIYIAYPINRINETDISLCKKQ